jgi:Cu(I)/Ag(I) efflux system membrane protein CusA/SilA
VPGTTSAFAERITGGFYLNIEPDREQLARYGLSVGELQDVIGSALGGEMVTTTVEGRERFGVTVRYPRELRSDPQQIAREVLVPTMGGAMVPLGQLAKVVVAKGTPGIRTENALLSAYIFVDIRDRDIGGYVADAKKAVAEQIKFPPGYYVTWSGQFEFMERAIEKMKVVIPITLLTIFLLLYLNFRRLTETLIVMLSVPFALVGGVWLMWLLGYNLSVAVAVGFIALAGVAAETGVVMLIYLDHAWEAVKATCREWPQSERRRSLRSGDGRRCRARAPEDDDRRRHHGRPLADHVGDGHRLRGDEPHRRADGRRNDLLDGADPGGDPGDLRTGETVAAGSGPGKLV